MNNVVRGGCSCGPASMGCAGCAGCSASDDANTDSRVRSANLEARLARVEGDVVRHESHLALLHELFQRLIPSDTVD